MYARWNTIEEGIGGRGCQDARIDWRMDRAEASSSVRRQSESARNNTHAACMTHKTDMTRLTDRPRNYRESTVREISRYRAKAERAEGRKSGGRDHAHEANALLPIGKKTTTTTTTTTREQQQLLQRRHNHVTTTSCITCVAREIEIELTIKIDPYC